MAKKKKNTNRIGLFIKGKIDYSLLIITAILVGVGIIMLYSASTPISISDSKDGNPYMYIWKQGILTAAGLAGMWLFSYVDYRIFKKLSPLIALVSIGILYIVGFTGLEEGGGKRWLSIGGFSFQPSEFSKVGLIIFFAAYLSNLIEQGNVKKLVPGFLTPLGIVGLAAFALVALQNHFSATLIIGAVTCIQMFVAGSNIYMFSGLTGVGILGTTWAISQALSQTSSNFRFKRIYTWLHIEENVTKEAYQINQSLYAIGSGGLFGVGLGHSTQKYLYLPEPHNDFIFAVLAEETGFFGCICVILLFTLFVWRGVVIALNCKDTFGSLIAIGIASMIGLEALINIAVVTNTIPVTGMQLPFFSYGGTAMFVNLVAVGILLSVSKNSKKNNV